ncbi:peroxide stress protein YaaA [Frigoribacterium sp. VKM Ac-1396]|uniref:YaaA family protein n=1 Tax=Frigoribacterium sp. VKM Ac-1396 TaxID=2783821 RepID=UPI00188ADB82|nr:peroxide stress protein YaaA [Frigoribacterium sp. VKM Ac-1396]MBF4599812.1 peroxide stress protein YaaA [Frigoribacterium sp. VKM Ac-1396]
MLFLLPPSETKLDGGSVGSRLDVTGLSFEALEAPRRASLALLDELSCDEVVAARALKLGPTQAHEIVRNRIVTSSPTMPALARYTGVLFDPLAVSSLDADSWRWAHRHVVVHSALFGLVRAGDEIPAYRLSHDSKVAGTTLKKVWRSSVSRVLAGLDEPVVDLRSEGYVGLGPAGEGSTYVRVVSDAGGRRRALNHFNKKTKGLFVRALVTDRPELTDVGDLTDWARARGFVIEPGAETVLVAESVLDAAA